MREEFDLFTKISDCYSVDDVLAILCIPPEVLYANYLKDEILDAREEFDV